MRAIRIETDCGTTAARVILHPRSALCAAVLLGGILRCFHIDSHELQYDEAATGYFAILPFSDLWGGPAALEPNPPLFYSLAWLVTHLGASVEQIRYISAIAGILCIPLAWLIARDLAGDFAAAGAALLTSASPQHIAISQYARAYALLVLLLMCAFYCLLRIQPASAPLQKDRCRRFGWWSGYVILAVAALYTHHTAIVILAALNLAVLLVTVRNDDPGRRFLKEWLAANVIVAGLYAPWLPVLFAQLHPPAAAAPSAAAMQTAPLQRLWNTVSNPFRFAGLPWIEAALLPLILFGAWRLRASRGVVFLLAFVLCGLALMVLASQFRPLLDGKTLAWASLFAVVAAAIGCSAAGIRLPLLALALLVELRSVPAALDPPSEGWRAIVASLRHEAQPQDALYVNYAAAVLPLRHYGWSDAGFDVKVFAKTNEEPWFRGHAWPILAPQAVADDAFQVTPEALPQEALPQEAPPQAGHGSRRVWLLAYGRTSPEAVTSEITTKAVRMFNLRTGMLDLSLFVAPASTSGPASAR
jgi:4-amino-4-deoxy-L-arabinose transferase-like glycosyltransferase